MKQKFVKVRPVNKCFACICYVSKSFFFVIFRAMGVTDDVKSDLSRRKVLCYGKILFYLFITFTDLILKNYSYHKQK